MVEGLPASCRPVGVFVDEATESILHQVQVAGIQVAQLHGKETPETCQTVRATGVEVWKAISVPRDEATASSIFKQIEPYAQVVDAVLLDAAPPKHTDATVTGGHGTSFDWSVLQTVQAEVAKSFRVPLWIAGGLTPENVASLLGTCQPDGIDISSGVEIGGRKSLNRIEDLRKAVKRHGDRKSS